MASRIRRRSAANGIAMSMDGPTSRMPSGTPAIADSIGEKGKLFL